MDGATTHSTKDGGLTTDGDGGAILPAGAPLANPNGGFHIGTIERLAVVGIGIFAIYHPG